MQSFTVMLDVRVDDEPLSTSELQQKVQEVIDTFQGGKVTILDVTEDIAE